MHKEVIILAGGFGTRLREVVPEIPKCLAPVRERPFIDYLIEYLSNYGFTRIILSLGYKSDLIIAHVNKYATKFELVFVIEDYPLGTGGAIKAALREVVSRNVLVVNGDTFFNINLNVFYRTAAQNGYLFTVALKRIAQNTRYGFVEIDENNEIVSFIEKKDASNVLVNTGFYLIDVHNVTFGEIKECFSLEHDFFESNSREIKLHGIEFSDDFIDIGIPEDFLKSQSFFIDTKFKS